jgi:hypothetical protein
MHLVRCIVYTCAQMQVAIKNVYTSRQRVITRRRVTPLPITPAIITLVHTIAKQDGMPKGLKISNCYGTVLFHSSWIAGVDFDNKQLEDKNYDDKMYEPYEPYNDNDDDDDDDDDDNYDKNENNIDKMDQNEVAEILQDPTQNAGVHEQPHDTPAEEEETIFKADEPPTEEETEDNPAEEEEDPSRCKTRSGRLSKPKARMNLYQEQQHLSHENTMV